MSAFKSRDKSEKEAEEEEEEEDDATGAEERAVDIEAAADEPRKTMKDY
jgi:hypothetical protein